MSASAAFAAGAVTATSRDEERRGCWQRVLAVSVPGVQLLATESIVVRAVRMRIGPMLMIVWRLFEGVNVDVNEMQVGSLS